MKPAILTPLAAAVLLATASYVVAQEDMTPGGAPLVTPPASATDANTTPGATTPSPAMPNYDATPGSGSTTAPDNTTAPGSGTIPLPEAGSTGVPADQAAHLGSGAVIAHIDPQMSFQDRRDKGQRSIELLQTTLLNTLGAMGFGETQDFRKDGERYIARTRTPSGDWITVEMDPMKGTITRLN